MLELSQKKLRELESLCTREQPPAAMSACPLHVNCRDICTAIAASDFSAAREIYEKAAIFPEILSRLCEEPCQKACLRSSLGGAVLMGALERAVMEYGTLRPKRSFLPAQKGRTAVIGSGPAGLAAALELGKKGFAVDIYEKNPRPGGSLLEESRLPDEILQKELDRLYAFRITLHTGEAASPEILRQTYDSVILAWGLCSPAIHADSDTFSTQWEGVFAAGDCLRDTPGTLPESLALGRRVAISADRYMKKVSLNAGREGEAPFATSLYVNTEKYASKPPVTFPEYPENPPSREAAREEAARCLECTCTECTDACAFMRHYKSYPKKFLREFYNNLSIAMGTRHANRIINSCSLCGQCANVCPHGLNLGEAAREARMIMVSQNKMPASSFEFALNDLAFSNSDSFYLARPDPDNPHPAWVYFPGCQLPASAPLTAAKSYLDMRDRLEGGVGLMLGCCGVMAQWAGQEELYQETQTQLLSSWKNLGCPTVITACPTCLTQLQTLDSDIRCRGIWEVLADIGLPPGFIAEPRSLHIHDACGARNQPAIQEQIRLLASQAGCTLTEGRYTRETTGCCGYGGLAQFSNPDLADEMSQQCTEDLSAPLLTYCINCRDRFLRQGAEAFHILELIYPSCKEEHRWPSYSLRRKNRMLFRQELLAKLWGEETKGEKSMNLMYDQETARLLEQRMILESDISAVVWASEKEKSRILNKESGMYIAHRRIGNVTFWVWYQPRDDGFFVSRVYAHRMEIKGE